MLGQGSCDATAPLRPTVRVPSLMGAPGQQSWCRQTEPRLLLAGAQHRPHVSTDHVKTLLFLVG